MEEGPSYAFLKLGIASILLLLEGFYAASEIGLLGVGRVRIKHLAEEGNLKAQLVEELFANPTRLVATVLVTITTLLYFAEALATDAAMDLAALTKMGWLEVAIPTGFIVIALIFAEVTPILYASAHPERVALAAVGPMRLAGVVLAPLIMLVTNAAAVLLRLLGCDPKKKPPLVTEAEIAAMLEAAEQQGIIEKEERKMLHSALEFHDIRVSEVMQPRTDIVCIRHDAPLKEAIKLMVQVGHHRLPVYRGTVDEIVGVVHAKDALAALRHAQGAALQGGEADRKVIEIAREPLFAHKTERIHALLKRMQRLRRSMAIVVDDDGGTAGLVTVEDLIEAILGEIHDEYDVAKAKVQPTEDGYYLVDAKMSVRDAEKLLEVELPEEEYDTLAELVTSHLERLPHVGDRGEINGFHWEVAEVRGRRVRYLKVAITPPHSPSGRGAGGEGS